MTLEEMDRAISNFIELYWGTAIGESVHNWHQNTRDDNCDGIEEIYEFLEARGYV